MNTHGYFDHNATTPLDPRVRDAMLPWLGERFGNPSSVHRFGRAAREAVEGARERVASLIGARPVEIVFTGSGTEASNAVLFSCRDEDGASPHVVVSALEHAAVRQAAGRLEKGGGRVTRVAPEPSGRVAARHFEEAIEEDTRLVCLMVANNEIGTLQPVAEVARLCAERGVPMLSDAVQAVGKVPVRVGDLGVDYLVLGGHKFHGPLGAAALWVSEGRDLEPLLVGGTQERRRRAGTLDVPAIVGLGKACELAEAELVERGEHLAMLRDRFEAGLSVIRGARVHCSEVPRLPNTSHVAFEGVEASDLMIRLDLRGFAVSTGSACGSGAAEISSTLAAIGLDAAEAAASLRISFGMTNTAAEVDALLTALSTEVEALRRAA